MLTHLTELLHGRVPGQLVIQLTDRCNARCFFYGTAVTEKFPRSRLSTHVVKRMLDRAAQWRFAAVSFTGGEPLLYLDDLATLIDYAGEAGIPYVRTGTNGFQLAHAVGPQFRDRVRRIAERLAATPLRNFWISIDSADPETHEQMRGFPGIIDAIRRALPLFHECGIYPSANLGINRNVGGKATAGLRLRGDRGQGVDRATFEEQYRIGFRRFYRLVIDMGFTIVNACYPMSVDDAAPGDDLSAVYAATSADDIVRYTAEEKACLFRALLDTIAEFRSEIRVFSPRCSLHALSRHYGENGEAQSATYPCRGGADFFFVDCRHGDAFPCGYRGAENLGRFWELPRRPSARRVHCRRCDWECFRDPSELAGPVLQALSDPLGLWRRFRSDGRHFRFWIDDWRYYRACDFFDGRKPPRPDRLYRFRDEAQATQRAAPHGPSSLNQN